MIRVLIATDSDGLLSAASVQGHAGYAEPGHDIVCAAATALIRSAARALESDRRFRIAGEVGVPGSLAFEVDCISPYGAEYLRGVTHYLVVGIGDLAREYPEHCSLDLQKGA